MGGFSGGGFGAPAMVGTGMGQPAFGQTSVVGGGFGQQAGVPAFGQAATSAFGQAGFGAPATPSPAGVPHSY